MNTTISSGDNIMITASGTTGYITTSGSSTVSIKPPVEYILDKYEFNNLIVQHRVSAHELIKLKEIDINYADHIKANLTKDVSERITKRMTFTKKVDVDSDTSTFYGRVWVFTKDELEELIKDARNA
jgi:hypothetical protein